MLRRKTNGVHSSKRRSEVRGSRAAGEGLTLQVNLAEHLSMHPFEGLGIRSLVDTALVDVVDVLRGACHHSGSIVNVG